MVPYLGDKSSEKCYNYQAPPVPHDNNLPKGEVRKEVLQRPPPGSLQEDTLWEETRGSGREGQGHHGQVHLD